MKKLTYLAILAAASLIPAHAGSVVLNGGFETGDFTSWDVTRAPESSHLSVEAPGVTGDFGAAFGASNVGSYDIISQTLNTVSGATYDFTFSLAASFGDGEGAAFASALRPNLIELDTVGNFQVLWNGQVILDSKAAATGDFDFQQFAFKETGSGNDTITFQAYNLPDFYRLDDVAVTPASATPEPGTWILLGAGLAVCAFSKSRSLLRLRPLFGATESGSDTPARP